MWNVFIVLANAYTQMIKRLIGDIHVRENIQCYEHPPNNSYVGPVIYTIVLTIYARNSEHVKITACYRFVVTR